MYKLHSLHNKLKLSATTKGFTLPELLVAATISLGVVSLGGFGLVSILTSSQVTNAQNERRMELNRALEFISAEVRQSEKIEKDVAAAAKLSDFTKNLPTGAQPTLMVYPESGGTPIVYYVAPSLNNTWRGPKVVYRWGPRIDNNGSYLDANTPSDWTHEPLIDLIEENGVLPTCSSGWSGNGTAGFFACVNDTGNIAELYQQGRVVKNLGSSETYQVNTTTVTRPMKVTVPTFVPPPGTTFSVDDGTVTIGADATMTVRVIGGQVTCGEDGSSLPTTATINFVLPDNTTDSVTLAPGSSIPNRSVPAGTRLTIDGNLDANGCSGIIEDWESETGILSAENIITLASEAFHWNSSSLKQVITLYNGDTAPSFQPYGGQTSITEFLEDAEILEGPDDTTLQLNDNQVVFLYELGVPYDSDYASAAAFDMQDIVVEAEISPS